MSSNRILKGFENKKVVTWFWKPVETTNTILVYYRDVAFFLGEVSKKKKLEENKIS